LGKKKRIILFVNVQAADLRLHTIKQLTPSLLGQNLIFWIYFEFSAAEITFKSISLKF
jgi:hypothetical protein